MPVAALQQRGCECSSRQRGESASSPRLWGIFVSREENYPLLCHFGESCVILYIWLIKQESIYSIISLISSQPHSLRASSQGIASVISQTVQFTRPRVFSPEKRRAPVCCTQRHGRGSGRLGKECGTQGLSAPPPHISAGHSGGRSATRTERFCPRPLSQEDHPWCVWVWRQAKPQCPEFPTFITSV